MKNLNCKCENGNRSLLFEILGYDRKSLNEFVQCAISHALYMLCVLSGTISNGKT